MTLEMVSMLDENSDLWDAVDIQEVALSWKNLECSKNLKLLR